MTDRKSLPGKSVKAHSQAQMKLKVNATVLKLLHPRIIGESLLPHNRPFGLLSFPVRATNTKFSKNQRVTDKRKLWQFAQSHF